MFLSALRHLRWKVHAEMTSSSDSCPDYANEPPLKLSYGIQGWVKMNEQHEWNSFCICICACLREGSRETDAERERGRKRAILGCVCYVFGIKTC